MILPFLLACTSPGPAPRPAGAPTDPPIRVAVVLGYDPAQREADTAERGAWRMSETLVRAGWRVALLTGEQATAEALRAAVGGLVQIEGHTPSPEDRLLVYVSGHGERSRDAEGALAPAVRLAAGSATVASVLDQLDAMPVLKKALVLDSCFPGVVDNAVAGRLSPRSTLVLTAAGAEEAAGAVVGAGGIYTDCLLQSWSSGSLLRAQVGAAACVSARRPGQQSRVYPPASPVFDLPFADSAPPLSAVLDGLSPTLPAGVELRVDGEALPGGLMLLDGGTQHRFSLQQNGATVTELSRSWPKGGLIGLAPAPQTPLGPDAIRLLPEAKPRDPVYREIAHASGLSDLLVGGHPQGAVAISLDGVRPGWFVTRSDAPPVYAVNTAAPGEDPLYRTELDLSALPAADALGVSARVLDLDQDGRPEVCYTERRRRLVCVDERGRADPGPLPPGEIFGAPEAADLDGDGLLDLLAYTRAGWQVWIWETATRRYSLRETLEATPIPNWARILDLDGDGRSDVLLGSPERGVEARFYGVPGQGRPWATALAGRVLGLARASPAPERLAVDGRWSLVALEQTGSTLYPVGMMRLGPAVPAAASGDERNAFGVTGGDLDLDGQLDLVHVHRDTYQPPHQIFLQRPTLGGWRQLRGVPSLDLSTDDQGVTLDDVDNDGDLDLLALNGQELAGPPEGCCRLFVSDAGEHAAHLAVDIDAGGRAFIGAELQLSGGQVGLLRVDGGRSRGAALFGLGAGGVPGALSVRWPDGEQTRVEEDTDFTPEAGGWRVRIRRNTDVTGRLLVGPWVVDLGAGPADRVQRAEGLAAGAQVIKAWRTPDGPVVYTDAPSRLTLLDRLGHAARPSVPVTACYWGSWLGGTLGALALGCGEQRGGQYTETLHFWRPGQRGLGDSPQGAPTFTRTLALDGDRVWVASGRRRVEARNASPALESTGLSLPAPEGAVDRTYVFVTPAGEILVADQGANRVEVWSGSPPTLRRLIPVGAGICEPVWDPGRGAWLVPMESDVVAVDPKEERPVATWALQSPVAELVLLDAGALAALLQTSPPELVVLDRPGAPPRLVVQLPPFAGTALLRLDR